MVIDEVEQSHTAKAKNTTFAPDAQPCQFERKTDVSPAIMCQGRYPSLKQTRHPFHRAAEMNRYAMPVVFSSKPELKTQTGQDTSRWQNLFTLFSPPSCQLQGLHINQQPNKYGR